MITRKKLLENPLVIVPIHKIPQEQGSNHIDFPDDANAGMHLLTEIINEKFDKYIKTFDEKVSPLHKLGIQDCNFNYRFATFFFFEKKSKFKVDLKVPVKLIN